MSSDTNEGWEERYTDSLILREMFSVDVRLGPSAYQWLSKNEQYRIRTKLRMVEGLAEKLAWGMLKGTLKYPTDDWTDEQWGAYAEDEENDLINYRLLRTHAKRVRDAKPAVNLCGDDDCKCWEGIK